MEDRLYAVKMVRFRFHTKLHEHQERLFRLVLHEARVLAQLSQHKNIARYYHTWIEQGLVLPSQATEPGARIESSRSDASASVQGGIAGSSSGTGNWDDSLLAEQASRASFEGLAADEPAQAIRVDVYIKMVRLCEHSSVPVLPVSLPRIITPQRSMIGLPSDAAFT